MGSGWDLVSPSIPPFFTTGVWLQKSDLAASLFFCKMKGRWGINNEANSEVLRRVKSFIKTKRKECYSDGRCGEAKDACLLVRLFVCLFV